MPGNRKTTLLTSTSEMDITLTESTVSETLLTKILETLNENTKVMTKMCGQMDKMCGHCGKTYKLLSDKFQNFDAANIQLPTTALEQTTTAIQDLVQASQTQQEYLQESSQITLEKEALKIKESINTIWMNKLVKRRHEYWQKVRNENLSTTYRVWKETTPIILPRRLQLPKITGEPDEQLRCRERQVLDSFRYEIDLLQLRAQSHNEHVRRIDEDMLSLFQEKARGGRRSALEKLWKEDCEREEEISKKRWSGTNEKWLKDYETKFKEAHANKNPFMKDEVYPQEKRRRSTPQQLDNAYPRARRNLTGNQPSSNVQDSNAYRSQNYRPNIDSQQTYIGQRFRKSREHDQRRSYDYLQEENNYRERRPNNDPVNTQQYNNYRQTGSAYQGQNQRMDAGWRQYEEHYSANRNQGNFLYSRAPRDRRR